jgi:hypothetical protein
MMPASIQLLLLIAQSSQWRHFGYRKFEGTYFEANSGEAIACLAITAALLVGLIVWHYYSARAKGRLPSNSPRALFRELCRAHNLDRRERRLLQRLTSARRIASPAALFVQPEYFEEFDLPDDLRDQAADLERLSTRLFNGTETN